jgi:hypothetical protein
MTYTVTYSVVSLKVRFEVGVQNNTEETEEVLVMFHILNYLRSQKMLRQNYDTQWPEETKIYKFSLFPVE